MFFFEELEQDCVQKLIFLSLEEDLEPYGDLSSSYLLDETLVKAEIIARESGILACSSIVESVLGEGMEFFNKKAYFSKPLDAFCKVEQCLEEGDEFKAGDKLFIIEAPANLLLALERTILNFLQRLCGIASLAKLLNEKLKDSKTKLLDTRKTNPGMRFLEKKAFACAGATNHRVNLSEMIMLKENHLALSKYEDINEALKVFKLEIEKRSLKNYDDKPLKIELEINKDNLSLLDQLFKEAIVDQIMLDNFSPDEIKSVMSDISELRQKYPQAEKIAIEASGGINLENIGAYVDLGLDYISSSYVSKFANAIDLTMLIKK